MYNRKKRLISALLSIVMVMTMVLEILPPIEVGAAAPSNGFSEDTQYMSIGDQYNFSGTATARGSDIDIVHIKIEGPDKVPIAYYRKTGLGLSTFDFSSIASFDWGDILHASPNAQKPDLTLDSSQLGTYEITVIVKAEDGNYTEKIQEIEVGLEVPKLTSHEDGETIFTDEDFVLKWASVEGADYYYVDVSVVSLSNKKTYLYENEKCLPSSRKLVIDGDDLIGGANLVIEITALTNDGFESESSHDVLKIYTPEPEECNPYITFKVSPTTVTEGEKITFSGLADGDGYKINAVSIGVAYYESEEKYYEEQNKDNPSANDAVYLRKPELNVDTFNYTELNGGSILTGSDEPLVGVLDVEGEYVAHEIIMRPGIYTITAHAYSKEYGGEFEKVTKKVIVEADEEIQEEIQLDSFPITNTNTTVNSGSSYILEWDAPANAPIGTTYSIFVWEYSTTTEVGSTTDLRFEIPSKCFTNAEVVAITVYANADGYKQSECEETLNVTVLADETKTPCVTSVVPDPPAGDMNTTYTFTAYAENTDTVVFYMNSTKIATVTGLNGEFVCSYSGFRKAGTRTVFAYPVDSSGNEVRANGCFASAEITIDHDGTLENIRYITKSYQSIDVNSSFALAWKRPENAPEDIDISYIVYVHNDDGKVGSEYEESSESTVIPASYFAEEGRYTISVYAVADNWSQSEYSAITVYVEASVPTISGYRLSHTTIPRDGSFTMKGTVDGNGDNLTEILVKAVNTSSGTSVELYSDSLNDSEFDLADIPALCPANSGLTEAGTYTISVYAKTVGATSATLLGKSSLYVSADSKIILDTPQLNGTSTLEYGENYIISWNYDSAVDYYTISVGGYPTKMTANASEGSYSIPASIFKNLSSGSSYNCTIYVQAMSKDTDNYLSSATAEKKITVAAKSEATAIIKSAEIVGLSADKVIIGGSDVEFKVVTSKDVTALRMKDGTGSFIINTWTTGHTDSGDDRIWKVTQKVNYAGGSDVSGAKRMLTFYSMIGEVEYNTYNISFYCQKGDTIGTFSVLTPKNESVQDEGKSLRITWSKPQNTEVDRYILEVVHNGQTVVREEVEGKCEYTLDGSYLVRDNNAWKIQVTARKDAGQWSESSAFASFTLNCTHEKRNPSSERVLSYANTGNGHRMEVEITSTCNGCGLKIVEDDPEIRIEEHKFVDLTEGGKVCNCCWYLVNDGTFTDTTEYIANAKANACTNVGSDGKPYGVQYVNGDVSNVRKVFAGDKVTILGKLNGCCLVQYPVSGGYWYGFVEKKVLDINNEKVIEVSANAAKLFGSVSIVDKFIDQYYDKDVSLASQPMLFEYSLTDDIVKENDDFGYWDNFGYNFSNPLRSASIWCDLLTGENKYIEDLVKSFYKALLSTESSSLEDKENYTKEYFQKISYEKVGDIYNNVWGIADLNEANLKSITIDEDFWDNAMKKLETSYNEAKNSKTVFIEPTKQEKVKTGVNLIIGAGLNVCNTYMGIELMRINSEIEHIDILIELFPEDSELLNTIKAEYIEKEWACIFSVFEYLCDNVVPLTLSLMGEVLFTQFMSTVSVGSFICSYLADSLGVSAYVESKVEILANHHILVQIRETLMRTISLYIKEDSEQEKYELAQKIIYLHDLYTKCQIMFNNNAVLLTNSATEKSILKNEIEHLRNTSVYNWKVNPYYIPQIIACPSLDNLNSTQYGYYYKILLEGYDDIKNDGLLGGWDGLSQYEKTLISEESEQLFEFATSKVTKMYMMNISKLVKTSSKEQWWQYPGEELCVLFVNTEGMGMLLRYFTDNTMARKAFNVLSKEETNDLLNNGHHLPSEYFFIQRHYYNKGNSIQEDLVLYSDRNGMRSIYFENTLNQDWQKMITAIKKYIEIDITDSTYMNILDNITDYKYYVGVRSYDAFGGSTASAVTEWSRVVKDIFDVHIDVSSIDIIAEKFNKRAKQTNNPNLSVEVVTTAWDFKLN